MNVIECRDVTKAYRKQIALNGLNVTIEQNKMIGLIGRNGAGKTTLLKMIAGLIQPTSGEMTVFGENPFNSLKVSQNMIFVDDYMYLPTSMNLGELFEVARTFYPNWDQTLAEGLLDYFSLNKYERHNNLSKGKRSTFNSILGLAAKCPLTLLDEPTSGMDRAVRKDFYRALLKDYLNHPRTIIISSHLLNEMDDLLEEIIIIKEGKNFLHASMEELKEYAIAFRGKESSIYEWTAGRQILHKTTVGVDTAYVVVKNDFSQDEIEKVKRTGIEVTNVSVDDLYVYLTNKTRGGIDDVFNRAENE